MTIAQTVAPTIARLSRYRWDPAPTYARFDPARFPRRDVVGEVKPHHADGISAGIAQLRKRARRGRTPQLVTYRQVPGRPTFYDVQAADSAELASLLAGRLKTVRTWYWLGRVEVREAIQPVPLWQCAATFGSVIEPYVRRQYAAKVGVSLPLRSASNTGPDIEHELLEMAEFLRELAAELEAEVHG